MAIGDLAESIYAQKLVKFHTHDPAMTTHAAIVNDNQARSRRGHRPLFQRYADQRWGLSSWGMTDDALRKRSSRS